MDKILITIPISPYYNCALLLLLSLCHFPLSWTTGRLLIMRLWSIKCSWIHIFNLTDVDTGIGIHLNYSCTWPSWSLSLWRIVTVSLCWGGRGKLPYKNGWAIRLHLPSSLHVLEPVESVPTFCITVWHRNCNASQWGSIIQASLTSTEDIFHKC